MLLRWDLSIAAKGNEKLIVENQVQGLIGSSDRLAIIGELCWHFTCGLLNGLFVSSPWQFTCRSEEHR